MNIQIYKLNTTVLMNSSVSLKRVIINYLLMLTVPFFYNLYAGQRSPP